MSGKKSWREVYKIHPAADVFPILPEDELRKLGEDIKQHGLKDKIVLYSPTNGDDVGDYVVVDGRNRLDAMELVGLPVIENQSVQDAEWGFVPGIVRYPFDDIPDSDPYAFIISKNIRRRHLTKEQQADLIVKVLTAAKTGLAKMANPVKRRNEKGQLQGQATKDPIKEKAVAEGKKHGISKRTIERSIAKTKGPMIDRKPRIETPRAAPSSRKWPTVEPPANTSDSILEFLGKLNTGIALIRFDNEANRKARNWNPQATLIYERHDLLNWIETQLEKVPTPAPAPLDAFLQHLRAEIKSRRKKSGDYLTPSRRWNPEKVFKKEQDSLLDWIQAELARASERPEVKSASKPPDKPDYEALEREIIALRLKVGTQEELIKNLRKDLALAREIERTLNALLVVGKGDDWGKWRKTLVKKYHPDLNSDKMFTASEVMADFNPLLKGLC